jgi:hypothetical protein
MKRVQLELYLTITLLIDFASRENLYDQLWCRNKLLQQPESKPAQKYIDGSYCSHSSQFA